MKNEIFIPSLSLLGLSIKKIMHKVQYAGFDGLELFLLSPYAKRLPRYRQLAKDMGIGLHTHEAWDWKDGKPWIFSFFMYLLGVLPKGGRSLPRIGKLREPCVLYPEQYEERLLRNARAWFQTFSVGKEKIGFQDFYLSATKHNLPVVFDTQHVIEYYLNLENVTGVPTDREELSQILTECWFYLGRYVKEIHLNDLDPRRGDHWGRNLFPGTGLLPLREFCAMVNKSGWTGVITPEVSPLYLFPYRTTRLIELRETVTKLFA